MKPNLKKGSWVKLKKDFDAEKKWYGPKLSLQKNKSYKISEISPAGICYFEKEDNLISDIEDLVLYNNDIYCI